LRYIKIKTIKNKIEMSKICQITGKKAMVGNNVSHSRRRTKRTFDVNLFKKKFYFVEQDCWISLRICASGLRTINKKGLNAALNDAVKKGYCDWKCIKVIG
jgi:large subunit ribosomal protein L28